MNIPLTNSYNQDPESVLGWVDLTPSAFWKIYKKNPNAFRFEPGFIKKPDGSVELIELSVVPNYEKPSMALNDLVDDLAVE